MHACVLAPCTSVRRNRLQKLESRLSHLLGVHVYNDQLAQCAGMNPILSLLKVRQHCNEYLKEQTDEALAGWEKDTNKGACATLVEQLRQKTWVDGGPGIVQPTNDISALLLGAAKTYDAFCDVLNVIEASSQSKASILPMLPVHEILTRQAIADELAEGIETPKAEAPPWGLCVEKVIPSVIPVLPEGYIERSSQSGGKSVQISAQICETLTSSLKRRRQTS